MNARAKKMSEQTQLEKQPRMDEVIAIKSEKHCEQTRMHAFAEIASNRLQEVWKWLKARTKDQRRARKLRVCETAQLGEKRFIALIQADGQRFLIGGTSTSLSLLATLPQTRKNFRSHLPKDIPIEAIGR